MNKDKEVVINVHQENIKTKQDKQNAKNVRLDIIPKKDHRYVRNVQQEHIRIRMMENVKRVQ